jgi:hypothetical protein
MVWPFVLAAHAENSADTPTRFRSHGDFRSVSVERELAELKEYNGYLVGGLTRRSTSFSAAIAKARELAHKAVTSSSLAATLEALPDNTTRTLRLFAFAEFATGRPTAAFAVIVAAQQRDEQSSDLLADLAGMLAGYGHPNDALAILEEMDRRNALPAPPLGISGRDAVDYVRGYSLARLGDRRAALSILRAVADREPQLAEAARMVAILSEDAAEKRKYFLQGVWRHRSPLMVCAGVDLALPEPDAMSSGNEVAIDVRSLIDPTKGKRGQQPLMRYAQTVNQANDFVVRMDAAHHAADIRADAILEQRGETPKGYIHTEISVEETWGFRIEQLVSSIEYRDARLRDLERRRLELSREAAAAFREIERERQKQAQAALVAYAEECAAKNYTPTKEQIAEVMRPASELALARCLPYINRQELTEREWFTEWHFLASALAAEVGDPAWHEYIRLSIEAQRWRSYSRLLFLAFSHAKAGQLINIARADGEVPTEPEEESIEKCDGNTSLSYGTKTLPGGQALPFEFGVEMTCEGMSLEASIDTRIPGVSISAEIGGNNEGKFTAFVGPKAEVVVGDKAISAATGSAKAGAYVTGDKQGVTDAGLKYEVKGGSKIGAISVAQKVAEDSVSFFPAPSPSGGEFGAFGG